MSTAAGYSAIEHLGNGQIVEIRALGPDDRTEMLAAVERTSAQSLRRRFFVTKRGFSEQEIDFFINIDFDRHVALVAQIDEGGRPAIAGGARYVSVGSGQAEIAFIVVDAYQRRGIGTILMRHLAVLAREAEVKELIAEVLPDNTAMLKLLENFGFLPGSRRDPSVLHLSLRLA